MTESHKDTSTELANDRVIGRIEGALDRIEQKTTEIGERLIKQEVRLEHVERIAEKQDDVSSRMTVVETKLSEKEKIDDRRGRAVWGAACAAAAGALVSMWTFVTRGG